MNNDVNVKLDEKQTDSSIDNRPDAVAASPAKMAPTGARYVRYIIFAFFCIATYWYFTNAGYGYPIGFRGRHPHGYVNAGDGTTPPIPKEDWSDLLIGTAPGPRMNATFVTLARNSDVWDIARSIRQVEDRFNRRYNYDWVFLNDKPFDATFKKVTGSLVSGKTHYGTIPKEHWSFPEWIDQKKAEKVREDMAERKIIYGDSVSYRHMCRFESGFFFQQ
jgi:alpha 1,2-mannosyltransferase